jgi:hypothetical protein
MQMVNIFINLIIPTYFFNLSLNITHDLWCYLYDNLYDETLRWNLRNALTINANGKYI